jgi:flagellar hook assembly protein FlgD
VYHGTTPVKSAGTDVPMSAGLHTWKWDGRSSAGDYVAPGRYKVVVWATSWVGTTWYAQDVVVETH